MEFWVKIIKKETEGWRNKVEAEFKKEVREVCSAPYDIKSSLYFDIPFERRGICFKKYLLNTLEESWIWER